ncbi:MAG: N-acetylmuramoyl-L-alanine amidase [Roseburia sp.]|nr:N-acetylmuramoyl-L-alanine amidase [Roseburia sp.]
MIINVHAGHNPDGKVACGAVGIIRESTEARRVKDEVISQLRQLGHIVYDCTCENGTSQADVLTKIVTACNLHNADLDVSIHFNAGAGDATGNGKTTGVETYIYSADSKAKPYAEKICSAIAELGFKNRGVKTNAELYFLRKTKAPAMLIECCFVDDKDDVELYDYKSMADAIVFGITGQTAQPLQNVTAAPDASASGAETTVGTKRELYRVQVGAYSVKDNADRMQTRLKKAGFDAIIVKA